MKPHNFEEKVIWYSLIGTYVLYFLGAQYVYIPTLAWFLGLYLCKKLWNQTKDTPPEEKIVIPLSIWIWLISAIIMEFGLIVGHIDFDLGLFKTIASTVNWAKRWALWALFPLVGCLNIRPALLYRAVCIVCLQSLIVIPITYLLIALHLPNDLYTSPLKVLGGGPIFYKVSLYSFDEGTNQIRLALFAPWAPALGIVSNIYFFLVREEPNRKWRWIGIIGCIAMTLLSVSRAANLCLITIPLITWFLSNISKPVVHFVNGILSFFFGIFAVTLINFVETFEKQLNTARASSSRIRKLLADIAIYRWRTEAPIWGHGATEEKGPGIVAYMPIGTHSTWSGLLYIQGLVGFITFVFPLLWSFVDLVIKAQKSKIAQAALSILLNILVFTFSESVGDLAYMFWPGLIMMGIAFKEKH
jgi:hypothetical protein